LKIHRADLKYCGCLHDEGFDGWLGRLDSGLILSACFLLLHLAALLTRPAPCPSFLGR
jgi:hypothetical protein